MSMQTVPKLQEQQSVRENPQGLKAEISHS